MTDRYLHIICFLCGILCLAPFRVHPAQEVPAADVAAPQPSPEVGNHAESAAATVPEESVEKALPIGTAPLPGAGQVTPAAEAQLPPLDHSSSHQRPGDTQPIGPAVVTSQELPPQSGDSGQNIISAANLAAESAAHHHQSVEKPETSHPTAQATGKYSADNWQEMRSIFSMAQKYFQRNDLKAAEEAVVLVIEHARDKELLLDANLFYARILARTQRWSEAAVVYERFIRYGQLRTDLPQVYLELGNLYRNLGAFELSLKRYYSVLNATVRLGGEDLPAYRTLSQVTKFEIAETYAAMGDFANARKFFSRIQILDLPREVRLRAAFREAQTAFQDGDYARAVLLLQQFVEEYPKEVKSIEASYMLVTSLQELKRYDDSLRCLLRLFAMTEEIGELSTDNRLFWQKRAGNQLANLYYRQGDYTSALMIYQAMAPLKADPLWTWPLQYQIGLCFEQLQQAAKAVEAYRSILQQAEKQADWKEKYRELQDVLEMAQWRLQHLGWKENKDERIGRLQYAKAVLADH